MDTLKHDAKTSIFPSFRETYSVYTSSDFLIKTHALISVYSSRPHDPLLTAWPLNSYSFTYTYLHGLYLLPLQWNWFKNTHNPVWQHYLEFNNKEFMNRGNLFSISARAHLRFMAIFTDCSFIAMACCIAILLPL